MTLVQVVVGGLLLGAVYALFSSGLTLIWGMMNVVNFAHGDFVMLGMYTAVTVWTALGGGPWASVPVAAILIATLGVVSYFFLVRHIMKGPMLAQILGTFGLALFLRYGALYAFGANFKSLPDNLVGHSFVLGGIRFEGSRVLAGRGRPRRDAGAASHPDPHRDRQPHARGLRGCDGGAAHGHPAAAHAGARLGLGGRGDRHRGRADRALPADFAHRPARRWRSWLSSPCPSAASAVSPAPWWPAC